MSAEYSSQQCICCRMTYMQVCWQCDASGAILLLIEQLLWQFGICLLLYVAHTQKAEAAPALYHVIQKQQDDHRMEFIGSANAGYL